jgi:hypothetical protein
VLDTQRRDPRLDRIRRAIDGAGPAGLGRAEISALFSRKVTKRQLDELLDGLTGSGQYEAVDTPTGGRPAQRYRRITPDGEIRRKNPA